MSKALTVLAVANAKADPSARREIADGATPGLRLVIQPSGAKSWAFRYERGGKGSKLTLGPANGPGALPLADARLRVGDARRQLAAGTDPADAEKRRKAEVRAALEAPPLSEGDVPVSIDLYLKRHASGLKSGAEVARILNKHVRPKWLKKRVADLTRRDVVALVDEIADRGTGTAANRTLAAVRGWLNWAARRGVIEVSPADRLRAPAKERPRDRVLADQELAAIVKAIDRLDWPFRHFFLILLLTAQRRGEVAGMRWAELDLNVAVWLIPAARTKNGREHSVPLPPAAVALLREMPRIRDSEFVFTTTGASALSGFTKAKTRVEAIASEIAADGVSIEPWRVHDFRRTAASGMARHGVSVAVVEKVLNHVSGTFGGIVGVYQRHDFAAEKRQALATWADHIMSLRTDGTTV